MTDHAVMRFIERSGMLDVRGIRDELADKLGRAAAAAEIIGGSYRIRVDNLDFVCVDDRVVTVIDTKGR